MGVKGTEVHDPPGEMFILGKLNMLNESYSWSVFPQDLWANYIIGVQSYKICMHIRCEARDNV